MIGRRVEYRGSLDEHWGRYQVAEQVETPAWPPGKAPLCGNENEAPA
jgi:hypothetical protein